MFPLLYCKSDLSLLLLLPPIILGFLYVNKNVISGRNSSLPPVYHYFSVLYDKLDFLRLDSNNRLYPSHSVVCLSFRISFIVCILASVISARFSAIASARAGFFGEPYSSSPWCDKIQCFSSLASFGGKPGIARIASSSISTPITICPRSCPS